MDEVITELEGPVARVTLNRPEALNAINAALLSSLADALEKVNDNPGIRVVILSGRGRAFCAGDDLKELKDNTTSRDAYAGLVARLQDISRAIMFSDKAYIAAVHGWAVGGGLSWALNADFTILEKSTRAFFPELQLGLYVSGGVSALLPALAGRRRAMTLFATGERFSADEALSMGVASEVVEDGSGMKRADELSASLLAISPDLLVSLKRATLKVDRDGLEEALKAEQASLAEAIMNFDHAKDTILPCK